MRGIRAWVDKRKAITEHPGASCEGKYEQSRIHFKTEIKLWEGQYARAHEWFHQVIILMGI